MPLGLWLYVVYLFQVLVVLTLHGLRLTIGTFYRIASLMRYGLSPSFRPGVRNK